MERIPRAGGLTVSFDRYGEGPPLVLVHGSFSDHLTNWQEVRPLWADRFRIHAVARRGRGETTPTQGHALDDEVGDVVAVLEAIGQPAFLLGHSYGALCALGAAARHPKGVRKLVLYEPPRPDRVTPEVVATLERTAEREGLDRLVETFMLEVLQMSRAEVDAFRRTPFWAVWTADALPSLNDVRAAVRHRFEAADYRTLAFPVQLLIGTESPRGIYLTDALAAVLPDVRVTPLAGQAHEGMTTAPAQFVEAVSRFLLA